MLHRKKQYWETETEIVKRGECLILAVSVSASSVKCNPDYKIDIMF